MLLSKLDALSVPLPILRSATCLDSLGDVKFEPLSDHLPQAEQFEICLSLLLPEVGNHLLFITCVLKEKE